MEYAPACVLLAVLAEKIRSNEDEADIADVMRQVETHLAEHLEKLPPQDARSRAVLTTMQADEIRHAEAAQQRGGIELPFPLPQLMHVSSMLMKTVAYRV